MRDDQRPCPAAPQKVPPEEQSEEEVPEEPSPSLIQVVGGSEGRARDKRRDGTPSDLSETRDEVADDDDLLEERRLRRAEDQHRDRPPVTERNGDHVPVHAERDRSEV